MTAIDLGNLHLIVDRPGATPAPTAGDPDQYPHTPWHPRVVAKACCGEVLDGEQCPCAELAAQLASAPVFHLAHWRAAA